jgi:membrane protease YdiL (CAAX protease family)
MSRASAARPGGESRGRSSGNSAARAARGPQGYFARSEMPLASLAFVLPLIVLYELGTWYFASDPARQTEQRIIAFNLMQDFFRLFGATGRYLPAMAVVLILLCWHVARHDAWSVRIAHLFGMAGESMLLAIPLLGIGFVATHYVEQYLPLFATDAQRTASLLVLSIGAGVYEELVFRLIAFTCLSFVFVDVLGMKRGWAGLLMVLFSSLAFALYHYLGSEQFNLATFAFRTAAGGYFGAVFLFRGFGITAGTHAVYDMYVVLLRSLL